MQMWYNRLRYIDAVSAGKNVSIHYLSSSDELEKHLFITPACQQYPGCGRSHTP